MIAGLKYRFLRARGLSYQDIKQEYDLMKDTAVGRFSSGQTISLGGRNYSRFQNIPEGNFTL